MIETAKAAKEAGVKTFVFISSAGTRGFLSGYVPYSKMKVGVEDALKELNFENVVICRPGMILAREKSKAPFFEMVVGNLHKISPSLQDSMGALLESSFDESDTDAACRSRSKGHRESSGGCCSTRAGEQGTIQVLGARAG